MSLMESPPGTGSPFRDSLSPTYATPKPSRLSGADTAEVRHLTHDDELAHSRSLKFIASLSSCDGAKLKRLLGEGDVYAYERPAVFVDSQESSKDTETGEGHNSPSASHGSPKRLLPAGSPTVPITMGSMTPKISSSMASSSPSESSARRSSPSTKQSGTSASRPTSAATSSHPTSSSASTSSSGRSSSTTSLEVHPTPSPAAVVRLPPLATASSPSCSLDKESSEEGLRGSASLVMLPADGPKLPLRTTGKGEGPVLWSQRMASLPSPKSIAVSSRSSMVTVYLLPRSPSPGPEQALGSDNSGEAEELVSQKAAPTPKKVQSPRRSRAEQHVHEARKASLKPPAPRRSVDHSPLPVRRSLEPLALPARRNSNRGGAPAHRQPLHRQAPPLSSRLASPAKVATPRNPPQRTKLPPLVSRRPGALSRSASPSSESPSMVPSSKNSRPGGLHAWRQGRYRERQKQPLALLPRQRKPRPPPAPRRARRNNQTHPQEDEEPQPPPRRAPVPRMRRNSRRSQDSARYLEGGERFAMYAPALMRHPPRYERRHPSEAPRVIPHGSRQDASASYAARRALYGSSGRGSTRNDPYKHILSRHGFWGEASRY